MNHTPDHILLKKIVEGNKTAFDNLFFKYYKPLFRFAYNFCHSSVLAEDSVQNTFIKIWKNRNELGAYNELGKVLFTYTRNEVIDEIRKNNTRKKYEGSAIAELLTEESSENNDKERVVAIIESAIECLPQKAREIFRMAKKEGLTINEIADYLKISPKTAENQLTIANKKMRQYLEPYKNLLKN